MCCYTLPWLVVQHRYQKYNSGSLARQSTTRLNALSFPHQEFEIDGESDVNTNTTENETSSTKVHKSVFIT